MMGHKENNSQVEYDIIYIDRSDDFNDRHFYKKKINRRIRHEEKMRLRDYEQTA